MKNHEMKGTKLKTKGDIEKYGIWDRTKGQRRHREIGGRNYKHIKNTHRGVWECP